MRGGLFRDGPLFSFSYLEKRLSIGGLIKFNESVDKCKEYFHLGNFSGQLPPVACFRTPCFCDTASIILVSLENHRDGLMADRACPKWHSWCFTGLIFAHNSYHGLAHVFGRSTVPSASKPRSRTTIFLFYWLFFVAVFAPPLIYHSDGQPRIFQNSSNVSPDVRLTELGLVLRFWDDHRATPVVDLIDICTMVG